MPWRSRTRMPMRKPAKAATVVNMQEPSIQASGIFSQLKTKPPTLPIAMASATGAEAVVADDVLLLGLEGNLFSRRASLVGTRSRRELFLEDALLEIVLGIEQQGELDVGRLGHHDLPTLAISTESAAAATGRFLDRGS